MRCNVSNNSDNVNCCRAPRLEYTFTDLLQPPRGRTHLELPRRSELHLLFADVAQCSENGLGALTGDCREKQTDETFSTSRNCSSSISPSCSHCGFPFVRLHHRPPTLFHTTSELKTPSSKTCALSRALSPRDPKTASALRYLFRVQILVCVLISFLFWFRVSPCCFSPFRGSFPCAVSMPHRGSLRFISFPHVCRITVAL